MQHQIRAVLFDLDGVVAFTDRYHYRSWKRLCDEQGWAFDEQVNHQLRGIPRSASLDIILKHNRLELPADEKASLAGRKDKYYRQLLGAINESDLYPGVRPFLEKLRAAGVKLGLCSSSKNAAPVLERLHLSPLFDTVVTGHDVRKAKPDPEIFLLAADRLGVPPFHCLVFEDAHSGVEAALAAGMKCIGVGSPDVVPNAPEVIRSYEEIDLAALLDTGRKATITPEPWAVAETAVQPQRAQYWESVFALTNGLLGLRGTYEEQDETIDPHTYPGMFVNGIYDYEPYHHVISFPGYPQRRHVMLNLCDWRIINLCVAGERFSMLRGTLLDYRRELDLRRGVVVRSLVWESPLGRRVRLTTTRVVSMARRHSAAIRYEVTPLGWAGPIMLESIVTGRAHSAQLKGDDHTQIVEQSTDGDARCFLVQTRTAPWRVGMAFGHRLTTAGNQGSSSELQHGDGVFTERFTVHARDGDTIRLDKHAAFYTNLETPPDRVLPAALDSLRRDRTDGFDRLAAEQAAFWREYWDIADIEIDGPPAEQQAVRFGIFHLRQSHPEDDRRSISPCGMTGDHYWGHVFWDTEMYVAPHFLYTQPHLVRPLLMYRYHLLDRARDRAREMAGVGALYAWNSISGEECGIVYEASTAEYHLLSDVAVAIARYVAATNDTVFPHRCGAEILFETARFLADRGKFIPLRDHQFCINVVCGPDEYGCGVNNNCYTNMLAQWHFRYAVRVYDQMHRECPDELARLARKIDLDPSERELWQRCADRMYIPFNAKLGIHEQDDSFLHLDPVDMSRIPLHTDLRNDRHPLNLWRMQVVKQADVVLLMFVLGDQFSRDLKRANYDYYEPRTNHGSSLSTSIHSIAASEIGRHEDAYAYFRHSAFMDLHDFKNNTAGGVHLACMGGTWMAVVHGFAGLRDDDRGLRFDPVLPAAWNACRFKLACRGRRIAVQIERDAVTYRLLSGEPIDLLSGDRHVSLSPSQPEAVCPTGQGIAAVSGNKSGSGASIEAKSRD